MRVAAKAAPASRVLRVKVMLSSQHLVQFHIKHRLSSLEPPVIAGNIDDTPAADAPIR
jgi:hypothetical protein